jgi:hypothetical protein
MSSTFAQILPASSQLLPVALDTVSQPVENTAPIAWLHHKGLLNMRKALCGLRLGGALDPCHKKFVLVA